jgi:prepilin-type N-terminal cleavage/methylation domain-containing protein
MNFKQKGFTMVEMLIVIGVIAVVATVIVLVLNPVELFKQARDAQRINDLLTIENIVLYRERINQSKGVANTVYISQTDHTNNCATLQASLPVLYSPWVYACAPGDAEMVNGTGWLPFNVSDFISAAYKSKQRSC